MLEWRADLDRAHFTCSLCGREYVMDYKPPMYTQSRILEIMKERHRCDAKQNALLETNPERIKENEPT